jgi:fructose-1,6-bisphosphatase/inositol monophosphatase family enzyme
MENYLNLAKEIADGAAEIALRYFSFDTEVAWKSDNSPVTQADKEINSFVIKKVQENYPEHSVYGEEETSDKDGSKYIDDKINIRTKKQAQDLCNLIMELANDLEK